MAQTLQDQENNSSRPDNKPPIEHHLTKKDDLKASRLGRFPAKVTTSSRSPSISSSTSVVAEYPVSLSSKNRYQPSKVFLSRCRAELELLLNNIKETFHSEIKNLYNDESYNDLFVQIGEDFKKPLHKCVVASRAFKLYSALRTFKLEEQPAEEDIIISEFQGKVQVSLVDETQIINKVDGEQEDNSEDITPEVTTLQCNLPENLISPDLFLNFARRIYLDTDLSEEEIKLNQQLVDWIKQNRPELIKVPVKHSPNHKESFRTIRPDFEDVSPICSPVMSTEQQTDMSNDASVVDDVDEASQVASKRDESLTSSLTRTETFELIAKRNSDSPSVVLPSKNILTDLQIEDEKFESDADSSIADTSSNLTPYAPTTRTGLKPKTFTTPTSISTGRRSSGSNSSKQTQSSSTRAAQARDGPSKAKTTSGITPRATLSKQSSNSSTSTKRSNLEAIPPDVTPEAQLSKPSSKDKTMAANTSTLKDTKPTLISRAHPISLERSQSPGTNIIAKNTGRNFIAANKRLVSQVDKKPPLQGDQVAYDSDIETSDASLYPLEPLTSDNLVAHMDKFTLMAYSKLADALSKMFVDGILPDTIIYVKDEKQINSHRCILAARSAYLAELINKQSLPLNTPESIASSNKLLEIDLREFSHSVVYYSVLHIYSGIVKVPDDIDLDELTKLSHLLHVSTLRQVCMHNLRMNYCHFFHKPCNVCCVGVLKTLPLAWRYDYTELYSKCLQWIGAHFASIFCLKEFSELRPHDLLEECYTATLSQLTPENIIPKTIECQKLLKNLPRVKWTESIICLVGRQLEDFCHYVADNYEKILQSESFLNLGKNCWECEVLEENLLAAMNHLKPDSGCKTLIQLHKIECSMETYCDESKPVSDSFANLVSKMRKYCERYLLKEATSVVHCSSWRHMNPSLQKRIKDQAIIATDFEEPAKQLASKPKLPSMSRVSNKQSPQGAGSSGDGTRSPSNRSTPESRLKSPSTTYLTPPKNKATAARHVKVLK